jgi:hypothetical protein
MIISIGAGKALDKIQRPFIIKAETKNKRNLHQHNKGYI